MAEKVQSEDVLDAETPEGTPLQRLTSGVSGAVILIALVLVCYISSVQFDYIRDDDVNVTQSNVMGSFSGLSRIWTELGATPQYYPMTFTTFWVERQVMQGLNPRVSHGFNMLLHAGSALILWQLLRRLSVPGAWAAAALFAVHPIQVESVAWISERKNTLSVLFALAATFFYLRFNGLIERPAQPQPQPEPKPKTQGDDAEAGEEAAETIQLSLPDDPRRLYTLFFVFFVLALLSKTVVVVLPAVLLLITWWKRGQLSSKDFIPLIAPLAVGLGLAGVTLYLEHSPDYVGATGPEWDIGIVQRLMLAGQTTSFYVWKLFAPYPLIFNYPRWEVNPANVLQWLPLLGVVLATVGSVLASRKIGRGLATGVLIFLVCLLPVMGFVNFLPQRFSWVADHFAYMPSIAFVTLLSAGAALLLRRVGKETQAENIGVVLAGAAIVVCGGLTIEHSFNFANARTLWESVLRRHSTSWLAAVNYGSLLIDKGRLDYSYGLDTADPERGKAERDKNYTAAEAWLKKALKANAYCYEAEFELARLALDRGEMDKALGHLFRSEQYAEQMGKKSFLKPQFYQANLMAAQKKYNDAIAKYRELQKYEELYANRAPVAFAQMRVALGDTLRRGLSGPISRSMPDADRDIFYDVLEQYNKAIEIAPSFITPKLRVAEILLPIEEYDAALEQLRDVLAIDRDNVQAKMLNAEIALRVEQNEVAGAQLINVVQTNPDFLPAYVKLAEVLNKVGRKDEALEQLNIALRRRPGYLPAQRLKDQIEGRVTTQPATTQSSTQPMTGPALTR